MSVDSPPMRVLIVKLYALGDILMATPLLTALKRDHPNCKIYWLVDSQYEEALAGNPLIDEVITYDTGRWRRLMRRGRIFAYLRESFALRRRLNRLKLDVVLNLHADKWWSAWFNAAAIRVGVFYTPTAGKLGVLYTKRVSQPQKPKRLHNSEHYLNAAKAIGVEPAYDLRLLYAVTENDRREAAGFLASFQAAGRNRPLLLLHPGTSRASKNWLPEQYTELIRFYQDAAIVITGSKSERELAERVRELSGRDDLLIAAGEMSGLGATAALIERASVVVTGDTAVLHLASALGTPVVGLYGSTRPRSNAPLFGISKLLYDDAVPCSPCYLPKCPYAGDANMACMKAITPEQVAAAIHQLTALDGHADKEPNHETSSI